MELVLIKPETPEEPGVGPHDAGEGPPEAAVVVERPAPAPLPDTGIRARQGFGFKGLM